MERWPHQIRGVDETLAAIERGEKRILLTSPTGGGKTCIACDLIERWTEQGLRTVLYSNRKILIDQTSNVLVGAGIYHGIRAADYEDEREHPVQVSSIPTEGSRVFKRQKWELHPADRVIIDEAHCNQGPTARRIIQEHVDKGAAVVGFTATPIDLGEVYDHLIIAGTNSELRACGALVPAYHFGPDEPDTRKLKVAIGQDLSERQQVKAMGMDDPGRRKFLFARVLEWFRKLNPQNKPSILFAPGVAESLWFAQEFHENGISAAHIDGEDVWIKGVLYRSSKESRDAALKGSKDGDIIVLCNRFVMREGVDCPWLSHGILATVFGSLQSYLQSGGRLLRAYPGLGSVTVQDHGGNWWRHGSLNADREWRLEYTGGMISGKREDRFRAKQEREPIRCPECARIIQSWKCICGYEVAPHKQRRPVIQLDGSLKELSGDIFRARATCKRKDGPEIWKRMYFRSRTEKGGRTFRAAAALFAQENHWQWPDKNWPLMPKNEEDWYRNVADVPRELLT